MNSVNIWSKSPTFTQNRKQNPRKIVNKDMKLVPDKVEKFQKRKSEGRSNKRAHSETVSPITTQRDRMSPQNKYLQRLTPKPGSPTNMSKSPGSSAVALMTNDYQTQSPSKAVPTVALEPPSPKLLPTPPIHWVGAEILASASRKVCGNVTQSLLQHLNTSGILLMAH